MDKLLRNSLVSVCVAAVVLLGAAATILFQVSYQLHQTPLLALKAEATLDYVGRAAKNFDSATATWKEASQTEADFLKTTLPTLTTAVRTDLNGVNTLLQTTNTTVAGLQTTTNAIGTQTVHTLGVVDTLVATTNQTIAELQPTESAATDSLFKFQTTLSTVNGLLADPNVKTTMFNVATMTDSGNRMLATADKVETKATHRYLFPSHNPVVRAWEFTYPLLVPTAQITGALLTK